MDYNYLFKYIIVGDRDVGKTSILQQAIGEKVNQNKETNIGVEFGSKQLIVQQKVIKIQIWDIAGHDTFNSITRSYYRCSIGALLVYDVTIRRTFDNITNWLNELKQNGNENMVIILVGNKQDQKERREVSEKEAIEYAQQNQLEYAEVSAIQNLNVDQLFQLVTEKILLKIEKDQIDPTNERIGIRLVSKDNFEQKQSNFCC